jgi:uncharacterized membrane protein
MSIVKGCLFSAVITVGPFVTVMVMLVLVQLFLKVLDQPYYIRQLFLIITVYSFIFSQIFTSGFCMVITRFIADKVFENAYEDIVPSLYGILSIVLLLGSLLPIIFLWNAPLEMEIKIAAYVLFMQLMIMWLLQAYLSALQDYMSIVYSFLVGFVIVVASSYVLLANIYIHIIIGLLLIMNLGILFINAFLMLNIQKRFNTSSHRYFLFLMTFEKHYDLFFISFFYTAALFIHNFIIWSGPLGDYVAGVFVYAPLYDVPNFYAFLIIIPSIIYFVVFVEVSFYDRYKEYISKIVYKGNLNEINSTRQHMLEGLNSEMSNLIELNFVFCILFIIVGNFILPKLSLSMFSINIFNLLVLAAFNTSIIQVLMIIMLYFEERRSALILTATFFFTNVIFTYFTILMGESYYGFGFFMASFITLLLGLSQTRYYLGNLDYFIFNKQPLFQVKKKGLITTFVEKRYELLE